MQGLVLLVFCIKLVGELPFAGLISRLNIGGLQVRSSCLVSLFSGVVDVVVVVVLLLVVVVVVVLVVVVIVVVVVVVVVVVGVVLVAAAVSLIWRFRFLIYFKHAPSFGDSGSSYVLNIRPHFAIRIHHKS